MEELNLLEATMEAFWELVGSPTLQIQEEQVVVDTTEEELQTHLGVPAEEVPAILVECSKAIQHQG